CAAWDRWYQPQPFHAAIPTAATMAAAAIRPPLSFHQAFSAASCSCSSRSYALMNFLRRRRKADPQPRRGRAPEARGSAGVPPAVAEERTNTRVGHAPGGPADLPACLPRGLPRGLARLGLVVADDDRHRRAAGVGLLHLRLEAARAAVLHHAEPRLAQRLGDL